MSQTPAQSAADTKYRESLTDYLVDRSPSFYGSYGFRNPKELVTNLTDSDCSCLVKELVSIFTCNSDGGRSAWWLGPSSGQRFEDVLAQLMEKVRDNDDELQVWMISTASNDGQKHQIYPDLPRAFSSNTPAVKLLIWYAIVWTAMTTIGATISRDAIDAEITCPWRIPRRYEGALSELRHFKSWFKFRGHQSDISGNNTSASTSLLAVPTHMPSSLRATSVTDTSSIQIQGDTLSAQPAASRQKKRILEMSFVWMVETPELLLPQTVQIFGTHQQPLKFRSFNVILTQRQDKPARYQVFVTADLPLAELDDGTRFEGWSLERLIDANPGWETLPPHARVATVLLSLMSRIIKELGTFNKAAFNDLARLRYWNRSKPSKSFLIYLTQMEECSMVFKSCLIDLRHKLNCLEEAQLFVEPNLIKGKKRISSRLIELEDEWNRILAEKQQLHDRIEVHVGIQNQRTTVVLTLAAAIYLPFSLISSFYGMNIFDTLSAGIIAVATDPTDDTSVIAETLPAQESTQNWTFFSYWTWSIFAAIVTIFFPLLAGSAYRTMVISAYGLSQKIRHQLRRLFWRLALPDNPNDQRRHRTAIYSDAYSSDQRSAIGVIIGTLNSVIGFVSSRLHNSPVRYPQPFILGHLVCLSVLLWLVFVDLPLLFIVALFLIGFAFAVFSTELSRLYISEPLVVPFFVTLPVLMSLLMLLYIMLCCLLGKVRWRIRRWMWREQPKYSQI